jgi:anti-sigma factor RsiW
VLSARPTEDAAIQEYLNGALPRASVEAFEITLGKDPELAARVRSLQRQNERLQELCADVLDEPVPEHLMSILRGAGPPGERCQAPPLPLSFSTTASPCAGIPGRRLSGRRAVLLPLMIGIGTGIAIGWAAHTALAPPQAAVSDPPSPVRSSSLTQ